jgi:hypothetical protein
MKEPKALRNAKDLINFISPGIVLPGRVPLTMAVALVAQLLEQEQADEIHFTQDIYSRVARQTGRTLPTTERAIYRAVDACWNHGKNAHLNQVIGCELPVKPAPREFILYLAYFLFADAPYHRPATKPQTHLWF